MGQFRQPKGRRHGATGAGRRIYDLLRAQIADGTLPPGARTPSTRTLAAELGVSRTTVTAAFEQLAAEGFLTTSTGRAARIASPLAEPAELGPLSPQSVKSELALSDLGCRLTKIGMPALPHLEPVRYDFLYGAVASRDFPTLAWRRAYQAELVRQQHSLYYALPEGDVELRRALQGYLRRARGLTCDTEQILIVNGSQQAIDLCARLLLNAGDAFVFEEPGYLIARRCFEATGADCLAIPVDADGIQIANLPQDDRVRLAYVTPSHQFPLGGVMPIGRRLELLQWAKRHNVWIVEDDYDGEFRYGQRPIDALQSVDTDGRVIYIGTFSKALSPQLRLGYMVLPADLVPVFRQAKRLSDRHAPLLEQRVLASIIDAGVYERHIRRMRRDNNRRRAALLDAIAWHLPKEVHFSGTAAGLHMVVWLPFMTAQQEPALIHAVRNQGVGVYPVTPLYADARTGVQPKSAGLILGYASLTVEQIQQGISILATVIAGMIPR